MSNLELPHTYLVAGGGGGMRSTIILRLLAEQLTSSDRPYSVIEGIEGRGAEQAVKYPSLQQDEIHDHMTTHDRDVLFISHCIGTVAALGALETTAEDRNASLVAIAPPLPAPHKTISTDQSRKKRSHGNTQMLVIDLPEGELNYDNMTESHAYISPLYFADIYAANDLEMRLKRQVEQGRAAVFAPEYDWNVESPRVVKHWHDAWRTEQAAGTAVDYISRAIVVPNAAHGLYVSPRSGIVATEHEDLTFQRTQLARVISSGEALIHDQFVEAVR